MQNRSGEQEMMLNTENTFKKSPPAMRSAILQF